MTTEPTHHVLHAPTIHFNLSPVAFRRWARHFRACRLTFASPDPGFSPVPYFLNCRALELELKARHLETATQVQVMEGFGHDLDRAYLALPAEQRSLTPTELRVLRRANHMYKSKGFEYFNVQEAITGFPHLPDLVALDAIVEKLVPG